MSWNNEYGYNGYGFNRGFGGFGGCGGFCGRVGGCGKGKCSKCGLENCECHKKVENCCLEVRHFAKSDKFYLNSYEAPLVLFDNFSHICEAHGKICLFNDESSTNNIVVYKNDIHEPLFTLTPGSSRKCALTCVTSLVLRVVNTGQDCGAKGWYNIELTCDKCK